MATHAYVHTHTHTHTHKERKRERGMYQDIFKLQCKQYHTVHKHI